MMGGPERTRSLAMWATIFSTGEIKMTVCSAALATLRVSLLIDG